MLAFQACHVDIMAKQIRRLCERSEAIQPSWELDCFVPRKDGIILALFCGECNLPLFKKTFSPCQKIFFPWKKSPGNVLDGVIVRETFYIFAIV
jgi:hypothetical protein